MPWLCQFFSGQYGLGPTVFLGALVGWVGFGAAFLFLSPTLLPSSDPVSQIWRAGLAGLAALNIIWLILALVAVWNAQTRSEAAFPIRLASVAAMTVLLVYVTIGVLPYFSTRVEVPLAQIVVWLGRVNADLPAPAGARFLMYGIHLEDTVLVYEYGPEFPSDPPDLAVLREWIDPAGEDGRAFCGDLIGFLRGGITQVRLDYAETPFDQGAPVATLLREECFALEDRLEPTQ